MKHHQQSNQQMASKIQTLQKQLKQSKDREKQTRIINQQLLQTITKLNQQGVLKTQMFIKRIQSLITSREKITRKSINSENSNTLNFLNKKDIKKALGSLAKIQTKIKK